LPILRHEPRSPKSESRTPGGHLTGRIIAITGASRGIGLAIVRTLGREGATLVLVGRDRKALRRAARQVPDVSLPVAADVTRPADVTRLFRTVRRRHGRLDILVNCAGVFTYKPFARTTLAEWRANLETNLTSIFLTTQAALPLLEAAHGAHLINILSISSRRAFPNCAAYCASKFGALGLTEVLREELRERGIRVTAILPGSTDTRLAKEFDFPVDRRKLIQPEDVAAAVLAAILQPARTSVEEVLLMPSSGSL
jgi:NAD(P)-dependent dehydrogenase (short-subunit alcohol dehydrogenase family)